MHGARAARGLDPRVRRRRAGRCATPATTGASGFFDRFRARRERAREVEEEIAARGAGARGRGARGAVAPARRSRRGGPVTCARCRPTPTSRCSGRSRSSTARTTRARSAAWRARSAPPRSSVRPRTDRPGVVAITVMWELSWYRFEIDLSDEAGGVRRDAQGDELAELEAERAGGQRRRRRAREPASRLKVRQMVDFEPSSPFVSLKP